MSRLGSVLILLGISLLSYAYGMDVGVTYSGQEIANIGLITDRMDFIMISSLMIISGLMLVFSSFAREQSSEYYDLLLIIAGGVCQLNDDDWNPEKFYICKNDINEINIKHVKYLIKKIHISNPGVDPAVLITKYQKEINRVRLELPEELAKKFMQKLFSEI